MIFKKTDEKDSDFIELTKELDAYFYSIYGDLQKKYAPNNILKPIETVLVGYIDNKVVACGCFRAFDDTSVEIKRMYVRPQYRGKGYAKKLLSSLEAWAKEEGYEKAVLETGTKQSDAISLYKHLGYNLISNYGIYKDLDTSICMQKTL